ncbi:WD repeat-containing protein 63 [Liparis tanakae]|uniref:WD repeat-containing protein 63 n=1 Tax=Liparis tanakae TaxID=230148 RepID=A0A4Z2EF97_9TELE|nr:WD repeat-containing protein 63 [Liparis tanakae]
MFWDVRASRASQSAADRKQNVEQKTPYSVPDTFQHLDRTWEPLFKVSLPKIGISGEYAPLKFSLEHYTCTANSAARSPGEGGYPSGCCVCVCVFMSVHCLSLLQSVTHIQFTLFCVAQYQNM